LIQAGFVKDLFPVERGRVVDSGMIDRRGPLRLDGLYEDGDLAVDTLSEVVLL
jgi:hypothetical protein